MDDAERAILLGKMVAAGAAATVATANPAAGVAVAAAVPLVELIHQRWLQGQTERAAQALGDAVEASGMTGQAFVDAATSTPERLLLAGEALTVATRTVLREKLTALAGSLVVAGTAKDDVAIDAELMWLRLIAPLESIHLRALESLDVARPDGADMGTWIIARVQALGRAIDPLEPSLRIHVLNEIVASGLAKQRYGDDYPPSYGLSTGASAGDRFWELTSLGRTVLDRIYQRTAELVHDA